jgi:hypothetical protein
VYIPNAETANQNLLIVGEAANCENAEKHILRLIEKVDERAKVCVDCTCDDKRTRWCRFVVRMGRPHCSSYAHSCHRRQTDSNSSPQGHCYWLHVTS